MKTLIILFLVLSVRCYAPEVNAGYIVAPEKIEPYKSVLKAMAFVESSGNPFAYNDKEGAVGLYQIRQIRIDDYQRITGIHYNLSEMFEVAKAEKVINFYCNLYGVYRIDEFIKAWNGSGPKTIKYLALVKSHLK
jgi:hypothetical protein